MRRVPRRLLRRLRRRRPCRLDTSSAFNAITVLTFQTSELLAQKRPILMRFKRFSNFVATLKMIPYHRTVIQLLYMKVVAEKVFIWN
jgi:hypothetical protein